MRTLTYCIVEGIKQVFRNAGRTISSLLIIALTLFLVGILFCVLSNLNVVVNSTQEEFGTVQLFIKDKTPQTSIEKIQSSLNNDSRVASTEYQSKEEALNILKTKWGKNSKLLDGLPKNPLPNSIIVKMKNINDIEKINNEYKSLKEVEAVQYHGDTLKKVAKIANGIELVGIIIICIFMLVTITSVFNLIKININSRAKEISIMKNVGATKGFIIGPFLAEGIILGLLGAVVSGVLIYFGYTVVFDVVEYNMLLTLGVAMVEPTVLTTNIFIIFISFGVMVGTLGSIISVRKNIET